MSSAFYISLPLYSVLLHHKQESTARKSAIHVAAPSLVGESHLIFLCIHLLSTAAAVIYLKYKLGIEHSATKSILFTIEFRKFDVLGT